MIQVWGQTLIATFQNILVNGSQEMDFPSFLKSFSRLMIEMRNTLI